MMNQLKRGAALAVLLLMAGRTVPPAYAEDSFRMPIADVFTITGRGVVLTGRVTSGSIGVGDWVCVPMLDDEQLGREIVGLELFREIRERIETGQSAGVLVDNVDQRQVRKNADLVAGCESEAVHADGETGS